MMNKKLSKLAVAAFLAFPLASAISACGQDPKPSSAGEVANVEALESRNDNQSFMRNPTNLICVSRDNDGLSPWTVGRVSGGQVRSFRSVIYNDQSSCESAISSSKWLRNSGHVLICGSKDQDGLSPWSIFAVSGSSASSQNITFSSVSDCISAMRPSLRSGDSLVVCGSQDNDGLSPWALFRFLNGKSFRSKAIYSSLSNCNQALKYASGNRWEFLVCASKDEDGISPYNIFSIEPNLITRTNLSYSSFDQCLRAI